MKLRNQQTYTVHDYLADKLAGHQAPLINNKFVFKRELYGSHTINFNLLNESTELPLSLIDVVFERQSSKLAIPEVAKLIWAELAHTNASQTTLYNIYRGVMILLRFFVNHNVNSIKRSDLFSLYRDLLMTSIEKNMFVDRLTAINHSLFVAADLNKVINICSQYSIPLFERNVKPKHLKQAMNEAVEECTEASFADYRESGSFDRLTLDYGRFYIEHVNSSFFKFYTSALAVQDAIDYEVSVKRLKSQRTIYPHVLCGETLNDTVNYFHDETESYVIDKYRECHEKYTEFYLKRSREHLFFKTDFIKMFCASLGAEEIFQNEECIKGLLISKQRLEPEKYKELFSQVCTRIKLKQRKKFLDFQFFEEQLTTLTNGYKEEVTPISELPEIYEYLKIKDSKNKRSSKSYAHYITSAGCTLMLSLLGWRGSEMGFPMSAINIDYNIDALDQAWYPLRFHVKWLVPKTAGNTKIEREITQNVFIIASMLQKLVKADDHQPCLYPTAYNSDAQLGERVFESHPRMANRCAINWESYVYNCDYFHALTQIDTYEQKDNLSSVDLAKFRAAKQLLNSDSLIRQVRKVKKRVQDEWKRISIVGLATKTPEQLTYVVINKYVNDELDIATKSTIEKHVPLDILKRVSKQVESLLPGEKLAKNVSEVFADELKSGCIYPSPHAFRHIWAESVYRRFSGDVGWFIRSNFKHFSDAFFYRYLKNKKLKGIDDTGKRDALTSLLFRYIETKEEEGAHDFAGKTEVMLRRLFQRTELIKLDQKDDLNQLLAEFTTEELLDIESTPWGYCIPRRRALDKSACAENGEPQQHLASPEYCFGCQNFLMEQAHVPLALIAIAKDVEALKCEQLPFHFKQSSVKAVRELIARLKQLDCNNKALLNEKYIEDLQGALDITKLQKEVA